MRVPTNTPEYSVYFRAKIFCYLACFKNGDAEVLIWTPPEEE
jgi:hypothetical protein